MGKHAVHIRFVKVFKDVQRQHRIIWPQVDKVVAQKISLLILDMGKASLARDTSDYRKRAGLQINAQNIANLGRKFSDQERQKAR